MTDRDGGTEAGQRNGYTSDSEPEDASLIENSIEVTTIMSPDRIHDAKCPPKDRFYLIFLVMIIVSAGILFPWNCIVAGIDYFFFLYPEFHPEKAFPFIYMIVTLIGVLVTINTLNYFPLHGRIGFGYICYILALLFLPLLDIGINNCTVSTTIGFYLTVGATIVISVGSGVQQSSYYGLAGLLPPIYMKAIMVGETVAGMAVYFVRVITKASTESLRAGAIAFFVISILYIIFCVACQVFLWKSSFVRYYVGRASHCRGDSRNGKKNGVEMGAEMTQLSGADDDDNDRDKLIMSDTTTWRETITNGFYVRLHVLKKMWKMVVIVFAVFLITLLVFPGVSSEVQYCTIDTWSPVVIGLVFNVTDCISRVLTWVPLTLSANVLIALTSVRLVLVPLLLLCVSPSPSQSVIPNPFWAAVVLVSLVGLTNGYLGTVAMVRGPKLVDGKHQELAGTIMVFFLLTGLTIGATIALAWTPLTRLHSYTPCSNFTAEFLCQLKNNESLLLSR